MRLSGLTKPVSQLSVAERRAMLALMQRHYDCVDTDLFATDLAEKDWVIQVIEPRTGKIRGFSTQQLLTVQVAGKTVRALFSGDTIVDRQDWGDPALSHCWGRLALDLIDAQPSGHPLYWFLITKGYRTYRFLPVFFQEFYPRADRPTPAWATDLIDALARSKFGDRYDAARCVVRASVGHYHLNGEMSQVDAGRLRDPHVQFFLDRNPFYALGEELCCLAPLSRENFSPAAYRVIGPLPATVEEEQCRSQVV